MFISSDAITIFMSKEDQMLDELRQIRVLLEPKPAPPTPPPQGMLNEFRNFIAKYKVLGLAVAFILGLYLGALVQALVNDLIMPIITLFLPGTAWDALMIGPFLVGHFFGALLTFLIVVLVIFVLVKQTTKMGIE
jgi:large conductance mechanosensitive channel